MFLFTTRQVTLVKCYKRIMRYDIKTAVPVFRMCSFKRWWPLICTHREKHGHVQGHPQKSERPEKVTAYNKSHSPVLGFRAMSSFGQYIQALDSLCVYMVGGLLGWGCWWGCCVTSYNLFFTHLKLSPATATLNFV